MSKTVLLTGGNRGLGKAAVKKLAERGMTVTFTARDTKKGNAVAAELRAEMPNAKVDCLALDVVDRGSIRALAQTIAARPEPLDVLVNNAGLLVSEKTPVRTAEGVEVTFATNLLGPFYLTNLLLPCLERSSSARIVNVASRMHMPKGGWGPPVNFDFDDLGPQAHYEPTVAYKNSKLAMMWFTYELARRLPPRKITANAVCPGFVPATAAEDTHGAMRFIFTVMPLMPFAHGIDEATDTYAMACTAPELEGTSGSFFGESKPIESSPESHDEAKAKRLWELGRLHSQPG